MSINNKFEQGNAVEKIFATNSDILFRDSRLPDAYDGLILPGNTNVVTYGKDNFWYSDLAIPRGFDYTKCARFLRETSNVILNHSSCRHKMKRPFDVSYLKYETRERKWRELFREGYIEPYFGDELFVASYDATEVTTISYNGHWLGDIRISFPREQIYCLNFFNDFYRVYEAVCK